MIERARRAFELYVEFGESRTLAKVREALAARGEPISLITLKRWSARYYWRSFIKQQEQIAARAFCRRTAAHGAANLETRPHDELKRQREDLAVLCGNLSSLREKFAERLDLPINDPDAVKLTPMQFLKVCQEELLLCEKLKRLQAAENPDDV